MLRLTLEQTAASKALNRAREPLFKIETIKFHEPNITIFRPATERLARVVREYEYESQSESSASGRPLVVETAH